MNFHLIWIWEERKSSYFISLISLYKAKSLFWFTLNIKIMHTVLEVQQKTAFFLWIPRITRKTMLLSCCITEVAKVFTVLGCGVSKGQCFISALGWTHWMQTLAANHTDKLWEKEMWVHLCFFLTPLQFKSKYTILHKKGLWDWKSGRIVGHYKLQWSL